MRRGLRLGGGQAMLALARLFGADVVLGWLLIAPTAHCAGSAGQVAAQTGGQEDCRLLCPSRSTKCLWVTEQLGK